MTQPMARIALVGDRSANVRAHARIPTLLDALLQRDGIALDAYWIATTDAEAADLGRFDAIWVAPAAPMRAPTGPSPRCAPRASGGFPFLGTCGGFQYALLEFARNVCGLSGVENAEVTPNATEHLIVPLECSLNGHEEAVMIAPGTLAARISGPGRRTERYHCDYGLNPDYLERLSTGGLAFSGFDDSGQVRIAELPGHPFFMGTLFQPELHGDGTQPHPIIVALAAAATAHATASASTEALVG